LKPFTPEAIDGNFKVSTSGGLIPYAPTLDELGEPEAEKWTAAKWHNFRSDPDGKLWFEGDGRARLLAQYPPAPGSRSTYDSYFSGDSFRSRSKSNPGCAAYWVV